MLNQMYYAGNSRYSRYSFLLLVAPEICLERITRSPFWYQRHYHDSISFTLYPRPGILATEYRPDDML